MTVTRCWLARARRIGVATPPTLAATLAAVAPAATALMAGSMPAWAQQPPAATTIVTLDGSNSMNARLPGSSATKSAIARDALRQAIAAAPAANRIGLAAFGSRRARDCGDAAVLVTPQDSRTELLEELDDFEPGGWSPVGLALRKAAETMPDAPGRKTIVLVLDDLASCRTPNPCDVAQDLRAADASLTIHVVGLGLKPAEAEVMACVAEKTGGRLFETDTAETAAQAIQAAMKLADPVPPPRPVTRPPPPVAAKPPAPVPTGLAAAPAVLLPGLNAYARLAAGRPDIVEKVDWLVRPAAAGLATPALAAVTQSAINLRLAPGRYDVEARAGLVTRRTTIELDAATATAPKALAVDLQAAMLSLTAPLAAGAASLPTTVLAVYPSDAAGDTTPTKPLWLARTAAHDLVLPAGRYRIVANDGLARKEVTVALATGDHKAVELALDAGHLRLQRNTTAGAARSGPDRPAAGKAATETKGVSPAATTQILIEEDDPDSPTARKELLRTAADRLEATLPAGTYRITLRQGAAETVQRIVVTPGSVTERQLDVAVAEVRLASRIGKTAQPELPVSYRITRLGGTPKTLTIHGKSEPVVNLVAGRYRIEAKVGRQNAVAVGEADFKAGSRVAVDVDPKAGAYRLKLTPASSGLGYGEVFWQVLDDNGRAVWRTTRREPLVALAAGRYTVRVRLRDRTVETVLQAEAGETRTIEVGG